MPDSLKQKAAKGVLWSTIERFSVQGVQFLIMIVMARLLTPHDYGIIGMLAIFIAVAQSLIDSGFSQALIRKQNRTETDNNTVFYFNIVVSGLLYFILYISAPFVADFYNTPQLCPVMRVVCISIISILWQLYSVRFLRSRLTSRPKPRRLDCRCNFGRSRHNNGLPWIRRMVAGYTTVA